MRRSDPRREKTGRAGIAVLTVAMLGAGLVAATAREDIMSQTAAQTVECDPTAVQPAPYCAYPTTDAVTPMPAGESDVSDSSAGGASGYRISVDGVVKAGDLRVVASHHEMDVVREGSALQVTFDGGQTDPLLHVTSADLAVGDRAGDGSTYTIERLVMRSE
jgi:hypothetical protein